MAVVRDNKESMASVLSCRIEQ